VRILIENEIQEAIRRCKPYKIAVAYIGADWNTYIPDVHYLSAIIVSPTLGSNPRAIASIAKEIGWEKVFFLDELHAKIYVGSNLAVIGSANLTQNGLSGEHLVELCAEVNDKTTLVGLNTNFDKIMEQAQRQYPTVELKKKRLNELEKIWTKAITNKIIKKQSHKKASFEDFEPLCEDHFYIVWYQPVICKYSDDLMAIKSLFDYDLHFATMDNVEKNTWVLVWRITNSDKPHQKVKPYWFYIHEVFENGVVDKGYEYPKCAIQRKDLEIPPFPFEITDEFLVTFKKVIQEKDIAKYLIQSDRDIFSLKYSFNGLFPLIKRMKECMSVQR